MNEDKSQNMSTTPSGTNDIHISQGTVEEIDLMELFFRILKSWKLIVCLVMIFSIATGLYTVYFVTPQYSATSVVYVISGSDSIINMADLQLGSALTNDYIKVFSLWEVHERVISKLGLPYSYADMSRMLAVSNPSNTRMLEIKVSSSNPTQAALVANAYADVFCEYVEKNMGMERPSIMSFALVPSNPVSPNKTKNVLIGAILGGMLACGIIFIRMLMDDKYKTSDDIRKYTGLVTLATIPMDEGLEKVGSGKSRKER